MPILFVIFYVTLETKRVVRYTQHYITTQYAVTLMPAFFSISSNAYKSEQWTLNSTYFYKITNICFTLQDFIWKNYF